MAIRKLRGDSHGASRREPVRQQFFLSPSLCPVIESQPEALGQSPGMNVLR